jgi:hypothetical protein
MIINLALPSCRSSREEPVIELAKTAIQMQARQANSWFRKEANGSPMGTPNIGQAKISQLSTSRLASPKGS